MRPSSRRTIAGDSHRSAFLLGTDQGFCRMESEGCDGILAPVRNGRRVATAAAVFALVALTLPWQRVSAFWYTGPPGAPTLVSPLDGVTVTSSPIFTWLDG